jgi:type IV pilus assembly protein PilP
MTGLLLFGCNQHGQQDLVDYIEKLKKTTMMTQTKKDLTAIKMPAAVTYQFATLRDPFEDTTLSYTEKGMVNPVNAFPLNMLRYTGVLEINGNISAVILVPDGRVYQRVLGDSVGDRFGKVTKIEADHIEVTEPVADEIKRTTSRIVILRLKE